MDQAYSCLIYYRCYFKSEVSFIEPRFTRTWKVGSWPAQGLLCVVSHMNHIVQYEEVHVPTSSAKFHVQKDSGCWWFLEEASVRPGLGWLWYLQCSRVHGIYR